MNDVTHAFIVALYTLAHAQFGDAVQITINYRHGDIVGMQITPLEPDDPPQEAPSAPTPDTARNAP